MIWLVFFASAVGAGWLLGHGNAAENARAAAAAAPGPLLVAMLGVTVGLCARDRVRLRRAYASPTLAWLAKRLLLAASAAASVYVFSPVAWPVECLLPLAGVGALGGAVWLGNLPPRL